MNINDKKIEFDSASDRIQVEAVRQMLSKAFWCPDITETEIRKGIHNSALVVGAYLPDGKQIGFLRVISDKVRFAYILDVIVHENHRRKNLGQNMVRYALSHKDLKDVYQWLLVTQDAHGVYVKCGFQKLGNPENWMSIIKSRPDRANYEG